MFKTILVGVDGSEHAFNAAKLAGDLARLHHADVIVVTCFQPVPAYMGAPYSEDIITQNVRDAKSTLQEAIDQMGPLPCEVKSEILNGPPAEAILAVTKTRHIDLIVMGTRGLGSLTGLLLGSQSHKVIAHAHCPVLLTK